MSELLTNEKTPLQSKTIVNALLAAGMAAGGVFFNTLLQHSVEIAALLQSFLPVYLDPFAPLLIQALSAIATGLFAKRAIDGRIEATTKIKTKVKKIKSKLP